MNFLRKSVLRYSHWGKKILYKHLAAELNRGFGAWDAKYRAAPDKGRRVTVRALP